MIKNKKIFALKKELSFLYQVAQTVHSLEIDELLKEIVKITGKVTKGDSVLVYVLEPKENILILRASKNPHPLLLRRMKMKLGEGITGWVAKEKKPVVISQGAAKDQRFKYFRSLPEDKFEAFISVPIINRRGVVGVINVQHKKKHFHTKMEINLLSAIGKLVGGAVENALLIEESFALKEALELRKLIDRAKGILMYNKNISEEDAYSLLRKKSMDFRKSIKEIAEAIVISDGINK